MGHFEDALRDFVQGRASLTQARQVLSERAEFSFGTNPAHVSYRVPIEQEVVLEVADVRRALERYRAGEWSAQELHDWAEFIVLTSAYRTAAPPPADEDYYDDVWDVLNELASPLAFGYVTPVAAQEKLVRLGRYE